MKSQFDRFFFYLIAWACFSKGDLCLVSRPEIQYDGWSCYSGRQRFACPFYQRLFLGLLHPQSEGSEETGKWPQKSSSVLEGRMNWVDLFPTSSSRHRLFRYVVLLNKFQATDEHFHSQDLLPTSIPLLIWRHPLKSGIEQSLPFLLAPLASIALVFELGMK
jgi:hypothetical protein